MTSVDRILTAESFVTVICAAGEKVVLSRAHAEMCKTFNDMLADCQDMDDAIPAPNISVQIMCKVVDFLALHFDDVSAAKVLERKQAAIAADCAMTREPEKVSLNDNGKSKSVKRPATTDLEHLGNDTDANPLNANQNVRANPRYGSKISADETSIERDLTPSTATVYVLSACDREWASKLSIEELVAVMHAANYLNVKHLMDVTTQTIADLVKGLTAAEIRTKFNLQTDMTDKEESFLREELSVLE